MLNYQGQLFLHMESITIKKHFPPNGIFEPFIEVPHQIKAYPLQIFREVKIVAYNRVCR